MLQLTIPEQFFVIAQNKKITQMRVKLFGFRQMYNIAACFIELANRKRIQFGEKLYIKVIDHAPTNISYLDEILTIIAESNKEKKLISWLRYFSWKFWRQKKVYKLMIETMLDKGVMTEEKTFFSTNYHGLEKIEQKMVERIRAEILEPETVSHDVLILTFMLHVAKVLDKLFSHYEIEDWEHRLTELQAEYPHEWKQVKAIYKNILEVVASTAANV